MKEVKGVKEVGVFVVWIRSLSNCNIILINNINIIKYIKFTNFDTGLWSASEKGFQKVALI